MTDGLRQVPRNRTLIVDCAENNTCGGQIQDYNTFNPFVPGGISRIGYQFLYEPLYFFNGYKIDAEPLPWIATGHRFNADYTEVVVDIRPGVEWSDGRAWTAHDFVFTVNMLKEHAPNLVFSTDMETWVQEAVALDSLTAKIVLKSPNPRFLFSYFTHNHGNGVPIVPKHIWEGQDPLRFANYDLASGWPVVTGPYHIALSEPAQRIWDLHPDLVGGQNRLPCTATGRAVDLSALYGRAPASAEPAGQQARHLFGASTVQYHHLARTTRQNEHLDGARATLQLHDAVGNHAGF